MDKFNPTEYLTKIQKLKYRAAAIPILLVVLSFVFSIGTNSLYLKFISLIGFVLFIFISGRYRIKKNIPPSFEKPVFLAPINGIVRSINLEKKIIVIKKGLFHTSEIRSNLQDLEVNIVAKKIFWFELSSDIQGKLVGIVPASAECTCNLPSNFKISVQVGQKVISGETIIGTINSE
ncbi:MAG: hypothetical protein HQ534_05905 [Armatimonadetes bacterium]|nr:hypothetical protein [Armatimonadota bacterium]